MVDTDHRQLHRVVRRALHPTLRTMDGSALRAARSLRRHRLIGVNAAPVVGHHQLAFEWTRQGDDREDVGVLAIGAVRGVRDRLGLPGVEQWVAWLVTRKVSRCVQSPFVFLCRVI